MKRKKAPEDFSRGACEGELLGLCGQDAAGVARGMTQARAGSSGSAKADIVASIALTTATGTVSEPSWTRQSAMAVMPSIRRRHVLL